MYIFISVQFRKRLHQTSKLIYITFKSLTIILSLTYLNLLSARQSEFSSIPDKIPRVSLNHRTLNIFTRDKAQSFAMPSNRTENTYLRIISNLIACTIKRSRTTGSHKLNTVATCEIARHINTLVLYDETDSHRTKPTYTEPDRYKF